MSACYEETPTPASMPVSCPYCSIAVQISASKVLCVCTNAYDRILVVALYVPRKGSTGSLGYHFALSAGF